MFLFGCCLSGDKQIICVRLQTRVLPLIRVRWFATIAWRFMSCSGVLSLCHCLCLCLCQCCGDGLPTLQCQLCVQSKQSKWTTDASAGIEAMATIGTKVNKVNYNRKNPMDTNPVTLLLWTMFRKWFHFKQISIRRSVGAQSALSP